MLPMTFVTARAFSGKLHPPVAAIHRRGTSRNLTASPPESKTRHHQLIVATIRGKVW
jgi:hypothetical protein